MKFRQNKVKTVPQEYYFSLEGVDDFSEYHFDSKGVPRVYYGKKTGLRYNPVTSAQYGFFNISKYLKTGDSRYLETALAMADWLARNWQENEKNAAVWYYEFDLDFLGTSAPWISAMAQGEAISLLLRANLFRPDPAYLEIAEKASLVFRYPIFQGGVCSTFPDGSLSLEEFPSNPRSHVLNGSIFALLGLYDYFLQTGDPEIERIYHQSLDGIKRNLHRYDAGYWTRYDLHPTRRLASPLYQSMHVRLMKILWQLTGDDFFQAYARQWEQYLNRPLCRLRWLTGKIAEKIRLKRSSRMNILPPSQKDTRDLK